MPAVVQTTPPPSRPGYHGANAHLPWWAVVLPVVAFLALLLLLVGSGQAEATGGGEASAGDDRAVTRVLQHFAQILPG
ncbi:hypothetical protein [Streptomyces oceani]|uniref:Uncharacterized protein n=1 Tax=Streptomyces oceani TaxID=1075402 RepID=A0A1E7JYV8_9ACTN|nr:hypothetical protein [Streptomyces oceani]OEU96839.1 hypothetical protein AN216_17875 [Streptomyces oceani]